MHDQVWSISCFGCKLEQITQFCKCVRAKIVVIKCETFGGASKGMYGRERRENVKTRYELQCV